jgi:rubredoxin
VEAGGSTASVSGAVREMNFFLFFGGTRTRYKKLSEGHFHCRTCGRTQPYDRCRAGSYLHLYWVPLARVQDLGEVFRCRVCRTAYSTLEGEPLRAGDGTRESRRGAETHAPTPAVKSTWMCPRCGNVNPEYATGCLRCGHGETEV